MIDIYESPDGKHLWAQSADGSTGGGHTSAMPEHGARLICRSGVRVRPLADIFADARYQTFEAGYDSPFSRELTAYLTAHGVAGLTEVHEIIWPAQTAGRESAREALKVVGHASATWLDTPQQRRCSWRFSTTISPACATRPGRLCSTPTGPVC